MGTDVCDETSRRVRHLARLKGSAASVTPNAGDRIAMKLPGVQEAEKVIEV